MYSSDKIFVNQSSINIYNKILNLKNLEHLLPYEFKNFKPFKEEFNVELVGKKIKFIICKKDPHKHVSFKSLDPEFNFKILIDIFGENNINCYTKVSIDIKLDFFKKILFEKKIIDYLCELKTRIAKI